MGTQGNKIRRSKDLVAVRYIWVFLCFSRFAPFSSSVPIRNWLWPIYDERHVLIWFGIPWNRTFSQFFCAVPNGARRIQRSMPPGPLGSEVAYQSMRTAPERANSFKALRPGRTYLRFVLGLIQALRAKERSMQIAGSTIRKSTSKSMRCLSHLANSSSLIR